MKTQHPTIHCTYAEEGKIIKVSDYDKPSNLGVTITKRGNAEALAGSSMRYDFTVASTRVLGRLGRPPGSQ